MTVLRENEKAAQNASVDIADIPDKYALEEPDIDCAALLPLCKARCCTMAFPLSRQDLDERVVRWDYGQPYTIARNTTGYCVHNSAGKCEVYDKRPGVCRSYDCRQDKRIWKDFEKRIPAD